MNEQDEREKAILEAALSLLPEHRAAYLARACARQDQLRLRLEARLQGCEPVSSSPEEPTSTAAQFTITTGLRPTEEATDQQSPGLGRSEMGALHVELEKVGDRIGRYKLLQQIGEGGCGVVYLAEQQESVKRRVALKVIKPGMDTRQVLARFEAERQALALMDHPNIAKVLDAGATNRGRPFFVMELVRGVKITEYCDDPKNQLSTQQRLDLFIQICRAIQHAHQKGVIHRDIKPSNILVTLQEDGTPTPKIIDFGIAKATAGQTLTDKTLFTAFEQFIGTPAYMSPEQAQMTAIDIDTRSDVYSLGVLLYELLTGQTPFDSKRLFEAGLGEIRRIIVEEEPPRPSTRLGALKADEQTTVAKRRQSDPPRLIRQVRGDLDWIVMKCLEKDRTRRYETANGLATDIQRYVSNQPVLARPPSTAYRLHKTIQRHKLAFSGAGIVVILVGIALAVSTSLFLREKQARQQAMWAERSQSQLRERAETEASKSKQVTQFLEKMLEGAGPAVAQGKDTALLREILDKTAEQVGKDLHAEPEVEAGVRDTIGNVYFALGQYSQAEAMHREALAKRRQPLGSEHPTVASSLQNLGNALLAQGKRSEAEGLFREALTIRRKLPDSNGLELAGSLYSLGLALWQQAKPGEAEALFREALNIARRSSVEDLQISRIQGGLCAILKDQGKFAEVEAINREALALQRKRLGPDHPDVANSLHNLAAVLWDEGKLTEAEQGMREALALRRKLLGEHPDVARSLGKLSGILRDEAKWVEAEACAREALAMLRKALGNDHAEVASQLDGLAIVLRSQGKLAEAETMQRETLAMRRKLLGNEHPEVAYSLNNLAVAVREQGKLAEAESLFREALELRRKVRSAEHPEVAQSLNNLAVVLWRQAKLTEAEPMMRQALAMRQKFFPEESQAVLNSWSYLADILRDQGRLQEAEKIFRETLAKQRRVFAQDSPDVSDSLTELVYCLLLQQKAAEAEPLARENLTILEKISPDDWVTFYARSLVGGALLGQKNCAEAEPLLLSGYDGLKQRADKIPVFEKRRLEETAQRLVLLYQTINTPDQAQKWRDVIKNQSQGP